jgi:hypothetical protein
MGIRIMREDFETLWKIRWDVFLCLFDRQGREGAGSWFVDI